MLMLIGDLMDILCSITTKKITNNFWSHLKILTIQKVKKLAQVPYLLIVTALLKENVDFLTHI